MQDPLVSETLSQFGEALGVDSLQINPGESVELGFEDDLFVHVTRNDELGQIQLSTSLGAWENLSADCLRLMLRGNEQHDGPGLTIGLSSLDDAFFISSTTSYSTLSADKLVAATTQLVNSATAWGRLLAEGVGTSARQGAQPTFDNVRV